MRITTAPVAAEGEERLGFATIRSYISATTKHGLNVLDNIANLYTTGAGYHPPPPEWLRCACRSNPQSMMSSMRNGHMFSKSDAEAD